MRLWNVFAPHLIYSIGIIIYFLLMGVIAKHRLTDRLVVLALIGGGLWVVYTLVFLFLVGFRVPDGWLRADPTTNWQREAQEARVAIILGFGYKQDSRGQMQPGAANEELLNWAIENTSAETILVQEGVWVVACAQTDKRCYKSGRELVRIHRHSSIYMNTLDTAFCAMEVLERRGEKKVILVAHPLQLQRAYWDVVTVMDSRPEWAFFQIVVPELPDISFVPGSVHFQTQAKWKWSLVEVLLSRPRDYFSPAPAHCKDPV
jgi:hypothetical protein